MEITLKRFNPFLNYCFTSQLLNKTTELLNKLTLMFPIGYDLLPSFSIIQEYYKNVRS